MRSMRINTCMGTIIINGTSVDRFIVDDSDILLLTCTKTWSEYMNKHALKTCSEYMNMHAVNTCKQWLNYIDGHEYYKLVIQETHYSVQWCVHMMRSMRINTCMGTINGTSVDPLSWAENMEWIHEHACSEYMQSMVKVFMQMCTTIFNKNNDNIVCNNMCTWWWVCAWILALEQLMEHQLFGLL